jgi:hypothetical protein
MQGAIARTEALVLEEERIIEQCEGVEDVEASLFNPVSRVRGYKGEYKCLPSSTRSTRP